MEISIYASTQEGHKVTKQESYKIAGTTAGVCYLPQQKIDDLLNEPEEKTFRRANMIEQSGHHSPFDHVMLNLELVGVPKIVAMMLNNEKFYTTSEKSARYKIMELPDNEKILYNKWKNIFIEEIGKLKPTCENWFTDKKIEKLAQENARYMTSVFTPTTMMYSTSYRQFNILYGLIEKEIDLLENDQDGFSVRFRDDLIDLHTQMGALEGSDGKTLISTALSKDIKNRQLSLLRRDCRAIVKQAGEVYCWTYDGSLAQYAQAQRHRTIAYQFNLSSLSEHKCYIPPIIESNEKLKNMWVEDFLSLDCTPQGTMVEIVEKGTLDDLILKSKERLCSCAQEEIKTQTGTTIREVRDKMLEDGNPRAHDLDPYLKGSRCLAGYECTTPCGYPDGVKGTRIV